MFHNRTNCSCCDVGIWSYSLYRNIEVKVEACFKTLSLEQLLRVFLGIRNNRERGMKRRMISSESGFAFQIEKNQKKDKFEKNQICLMIFMRRGKSIDFH